MLIKVAVVACMSLCVLFVAIRYDTLLSKRTSKLRCTALFALIMVLFLLAALMYPKKEEKPPRNWTYELIHLTPLPCPALPTPSNITITKIAAKNSPIFFQQTELFSSNSETITITQNPTYGTFYIESYASIMYDPDFDFLGCDVIRVQRTGNAISPPQVTIIDIRITILISPALTRPQLDLPTGYQMAEINKQRNAAVRAKFEEAEYRQNYPLIDTWYNQRFSTCAIVANGGILKGSGHGKEIDSHDAVFRFNAAPIKGFEHDVGYKLTFMWSCSRWIHTCWTFAEGSPDCEERTEHYHLFAQPLKVEHFDLVPECKSKLEAANKNITFNVLSYQWMNLADAILKDYVNDPTLKQDKRRSTGMAVLMAASTICDSVRLYGFGNSMNGILHYWEETQHDQEYPIHNFNAEHVFFADMMKGEGIYQKYLRAYNVTSDIQYVHTLTL